MKAQWEKYSAVIDAKTFRERSIIALLLLAVVWSVFNFAFIIPQEKEKAELRLRMKTAQEELGKLTAQERVFAQALTNDPNANKKAQIDQLEKKLDTLEQSLQTLSVGLIPADKLPDALHEVLRSVGNLKLLGMETRAAARLQLQHEIVGEAAEEPSDDNKEKAADKKVADVAEAEEDKVGVFKHAVVVSLEGSYFDVVAYLKALESLEWKVYWQGIDYRVDGYPKAQVTIEVYTLSTEEGLLGV